MRKNLLVFVFALLTCICWGQSVILDACGESCVSEAEALKEAEADAIRKAGVEVSEVCTIETRDTKTNVNRWVSSNSQAVVKVLSRNTERIGRRFIVNINAEVFFMPSMPSVYVSDLQRKYTIDRNFCFNLLSTDRSYLTVFWFDDDSDICGVLYNSVKIPSNKIVRCPNGGSLRDKIASYFDGRTTFEVIDSNGDIKYVRKYDVEKVFPKPGIHQKKSECRWGVHSKPNVDKNITLIFLTTPDYFPFTPRTRMFTKNDFIDWYFEIPLEMRRRLVREKIVLVI